jgi:hypothetical protein
MKDTNKSYFTHYWTNPFLQDIAGYQCARDENRGPFSRYVQERGGVIGQEVLSNLG